MNVEARISDYNLEFAHVALEGRSFNKDEVKKSAQLALKEYQRIETAGASCAVCILIDDKHVKAKVTYKDIPAFRDFVISHFPRVDYICFEKNLPRYKEQIFSSLRPDRRDHVEAEIWRYQRKHRQLGCSHDIAIWHLIRLGLINNIDAAILPLVGWGNSRGSAPPFVARNLISILSEKDSAFEKKACEDILDYCVESKSISNIKRIYYK